MNITKSKKFFFQKFRLDVAEQLLQAVCIPDYKKRETMSLGSTLNRLQTTQWGHYPKNIPPTNANKKPQQRCRVCTKHKKRSETVWEFNKSLVPLHVPDCFKRYHTLHVIINK
ncbi:hypothetical protein M0804_013529 [Polistes exclamans]|nr:hypothetical protein M0804_013529 [Polistes exclamans]